MTYTDCFFKDKELNNLLYGSYEPGAGDIENNLDGVIHRVLIFSICFLYCHWLNNEDKAASEYSELINKCFNNMIIKNKICYDTAIFILSNLYFEKVTEADDSDLDISNVPNNIMFNNLYSIMINFTDDDNKNKIKNKIMVRDTFFSLIQMLSFLSDLKIELHKNDCNIRTDDDEIIETCNLTIEFKGMKYNMHELIRMFDKQYFFIQDYTNFGDYLMYRDITGNENDTLLVNRFIWERKRKK